MTKTNNTLDDRKNTEISIKGPIQIKNIDSGKNTFWDIFKRVSVIIGFFGGLLGLTVTGFVVNDRWFKEAEIRSKIVSFASSDGIFEIMKLSGSTSPPEYKYGVRFFLKLSLNIIKKDLNYHDIEVLVKFNKIDSIFKGEIHSPRNYNEWVFDSDSLRLMLPQKNLLYYKSVLKHNTTHLEYINFIIFDKDNFIKNNLKGHELFPEYIQLIFYNSEKNILKKRNKIILTNQLNMNFDIKKLLWEDEIWMKNDKNDL